MNNYQKELIEILYFFNELETSRNEKIKTQLITNIIEKINEHQNTISRDCVSDFSSEYVEKINIAKEDMEVIKRYPEKAKIHIENAKQNIRLAKDINWQSLDD